jgi:hypothetical protein
MNATAPGVSISLFKDLYEAIRLVATDIHGLAGIPKKKQTEMLKAIADAYAILNMATSLVATRLGKVLERADVGTPKAFAEELAALRSSSEWYQIERDASLCSAMRSTRHELNGFVSRHFVKNWTKIEAQVDLVLGNESDLARHISATLESLSSLAPSVTESAQKHEDARLAVEAARNDLLAERRELIRDEAALLDAIYQPGKAR